MFSQTADRININSLIQSIKSEESSLGILTQVTLPFIIAGYGTVGAGMVLDIVQVSNCKYVTHIDINSCMKQDSF